MFKVQNIESGYKLRGVSTVVYTWGWNMSNNFDVKHIDKESSVESITNKWRSVHLYRYQRYSPVIIPIIVFCTLILIDAHRFVATLAVLALGSLFLILSGSIMPALYILILGMFAFNKGFAYLHIGGRVPVYVTELVLAVFLLRSFLLFPTRKTIKEMKTVLDIPFAFYYLIGVILLVRDLPTYGIAAIRDFVIVYYSLFFYVMTENIRSFEDVRRIVKVVFIGGAISTVFLCARMLPWFTYLFMPPLDKAILVGFTTLISLSLLFFIALRGYLVRKKFLSFVLLVTSCIQILAIMIARIRSTWVALVVSYVFLFAISKGPRRHILLVSVPVFVLILMLTWGYGYFMEPTLFSSLYIEGRSVFDLNMQTVSAATSLWRIATGKIGVQQFLRNPFGSGFGRPADMAFVNIAGGGKDPEVGYHNAPLAILVRMGFLGLLAFLCINAIFYYCTIKFCITTNEPLYRDYMIGIVAGHLSLVVVSLLFQFIQNPYMGIFYWIFMGLGIALINVSADLRPEDRRSE